MKKLLDNVTLVGEHELKQNCSVVIDGGTVEAVTDRYGLNKSTYEVLPGKGLYAFPGFIDLHVHGGGGIEFMAATPQEMAEGITAHARHGTTAILPTTLADVPEKLLSMIRATRQAAETCTDCDILGIHLEGPFLSPDQAGAQNPEALRLPDEELLEELLAAWPGGVKMMGAAPELTGGLQLGRTLKSSGIVASIAHSDADYETCMRAAEYGYSDITHIYSGCSAVHRVNGYRHGGVVESGLLDDRFTVQVIADGRHLPPELLRLILKCKGPDQIALITDALFAAGADYPDGELFRQANGMETVLEDGVMKMADRQAFAGSVATMDWLVRNMVNLAGARLWEAARMASLTPAHILGVDGRKGRIAPGYDADIVLMDESLTVRQVLTRGKPVAMDNGAV